MDPERSLLEQSAQLPYDMDFEFPRERVRMISVLGSGAFGEVSKFSYEISIFKTIKYNIC